MGLAVKMGLNYTRAGAPGNTIAFKIQVPGLQTVAVPFLLLFNDLLLVSIFF